MKYRPEIDGLRAVAVIPVLLYHAGFSWFSGGYIGVDVFFVISGYLITTILINEIQAGNFSIWRFYERRARRILPALCFVMLASIPFAWKWMLPDQFKDFGQSVLAVVFFASNILFWQESGYFEVSGEEKPLLHTWSLAVEEQYYMLFPLFLLIVFRYGKQRVFWSICVMAFASFAISEWGWRNRPDANFYLLPSRIWELLAGSIAAFIMSNGAVRANGFYATVGGIAILGGVFLFDHRTPFPSVYTLFPVFGAVLVILYGQSGTFVARVLRVSVLVGLGLISYSIYLWHQPLFAFARIRSIHDPSMAMMIALCMVSIIFAYFTWAYVEQPFRRKAGWLKPRFRIFWLSGASLAIFGVFGLWVHVKNGAEFRLPSDVQNLMAVRQGDSTNCHNALDHQQIIAGETCFIGLAGVTPTIAILGDSHAARISDAVADALTARAQAAILYNGSWCAPLMHFATNAAKKNGCVENVNAAIEYINEQPQIETVVLFAEWSNYTSGTRHGKKDIDAYIFDIKGEFSFQGITSSGNVDQFKKATSYTFDRLAATGKRVIIVMPTPEYEFNVPKSLAKLQLFNQNQATLPAVTQPIYSARNQDALTILHHYGDANNFHIVDPFSIFCALGTCAFANEQGQALYEDDNHLNYLGAQMLVPSILKKMSPAY